MVKIVVASGKGGVGKSMISSSFAILYSNLGKVVACDCDVDAPNMGLWMGIDESENCEKISTSEKAVITDQEGLDENILNICNFNSIEKRNGKYEINPFLCEGCGACKVLYPDSIKMEKVENGEICAKDTEFGFPIISGQLYPGEAGSGKIVELLRKKSDEFKAEYMIMDSAAGIGCPVIASIRGTDFVVLVTEPTPSGISDLKRIIGIVEQFDVPYGVIINKWDINEPVSVDISDWLGDKIIGKISYDKGVIESIVNLQPVICSDSKIVTEIKQIFNNLNNLLKS